MGAGGCLGPKKTKDEIYAKLITEMHEQAHKISHPDTKNLDMYQLIKQKITKKGYLRKFIDNLSSHRHKIIDSFNLNYKLTVQTKEVQKHYAGLIVADSLIQMVSSTFALEEKSDDTQFRQQRDSYAQSMVKSASKVAQGDTTKHLRKLITEKRVDIYEQHNNFYDQLYLRIVWYLFQNEKKMHYRLLQSLILFCNKHLGIIGCEHFVWKIIDKLNRNIQNNLFLAESCCLFNLLLQRTRDEAGEQLRNEQVLSMIIRTWLQQKESLEVESGEIQQDCQQIICTYFHRCISLWYSEFLYQVIFVFYDSISFSKIQQGLLEKLIQKILENLDLKSHFFRGLFNYLLAYLSVTLQSLNSEQDKKLFSTCLGLSSEKFRSHYKNIFKDHIKLQGFKLLNNWITKKYTDINQFCMYNNQSLILVYLSNSKYYYKNKMMLDAIIDEYFKIITKLDLGNRRLFVQRLEQAFRQQKYSKIQQELMLRLLKQCVHRNIFSEQSSTHTSMYLYLTPISSKYSSDLKQQLLKLTGYLFESSSVSSQKINEQQKYKICQFLFSIYENINIAIESIEQKYQFVCASLSVIRIVYYRFKQNVLVLPIAHILIAYMHKLGKQILVLLESKGYKVYNAYMAVYLYEEILFILDVDKQRNKKVREKIIEINNNICLDLDEIGTNTQNEKRNILQLNVQQFLASIKIEYPEFLSFSFTLSKEIEEQYRAIFTRVFSSSTLPNQSNNKFQMGRKTSRDSGSFSAYSRTSQMMKNCQKCRGNDNIQCKCRQMKKNWRASDYSFQEVIDIVHV